MYFKRSTTMRNRLLIRSFLLLVTCTGFLFATHQQLNAQTAVPPERAAADVPVIDGGAGPCTLQLTVTTVDDKPVYDAKVKVHIAYRFGGFHKLDLEAGTNTEGKVKFVGLPARVRRPPLEFQASKDQLVGVLTYDPATECQAEHKLTLDLPKSEKPNSSQVP
jgi:hypothetical protein